MSLLELLQLIHQQHIFLRPGRSGCIRLWSPNKRVPRTARQAIKAHTPTLSEMLSSHDVNVCPAQQLHREHWKYAGNGRYSCDECKRLQAHIMPELKVNHIKERKAS